MNRHSVLSDLGRLPAFLGRRTVKYLVFGLLNGLALFFIELSFGYGLQAFLVAIGVLKREAAFIPLWIPKTGLGQVLSFVTAVGVARGFFQWLQVYLSQGVSEAQKLQQRRRVVDWVFASQSVSTTEATTLFNDHAASAGEAAMNLHRLTVVLVSSTLLWAYLFHLSPRPTLVATAASVVVALLASRIDRRIAAIGSVAMGEARATLGGVLESIRNLVLIQIYGTQEQESRKIHRSLENSFTNLMRFTRLLGIKFILPQLIGVFLISIITYVSLRGGDIAPSLLVTYFYLFVRLAQSLAEASVQATSLAFHWPRLTYLFQWWKQHGESLADSVARPGVPLTEPVGWELQGTGFRYPEAQCSVFSDLSFKLQPRETLVICGPSGAGKSTLIFLMLGLSRPDRGEVFLVRADGEKLPLKQNQARLLASVGYVGPESFMLEGSIRSNLLYGLSYLPTDEQLWGALNCAECQFVSNLPRRLDHPITEQGQGLSAGQKQRLALARALLRKPKVLVLDEATANLDRQTEERLVATLGRLKNTMTIIAATHRQPLLAIADQRVELSAET